MSPARAAIGLVLMLGIACGGEAGSSAQAIPGITAAMDFADEASFYSAPFPSEHRRRNDGSIRLDTFPNPDGIDLVEQVRTLLERDARGFSLTSGAFFRFDGAIDENGLPPTPIDSLKADAAILWVDVDPESPERGRHFAFYASFSSDPGPYGEPHLLSVVPYQGTPLRPETRYAVAVRRSLEDADGTLLGVSLEMAQLARGQRPARLGDAAYGEYAHALDELRDLGIEPRSLAAVAVFRTDDPTRGMRALAQHVEEIPIPTPRMPWRALEIFEDFCVLASEIDMPVFQEGRPPFLSGGGRIRFDTAGRPVVQGGEASRLFVTIPRRTPRSDAGFPFVLFLRSGGGGDRPLVDRGRRAEPGGAAVEPGEGPARYFARAGYAAITFDGPHGGARNVSGIDEQLLIFNFLNPGALRDNIRENATEAILVARLATSLEFSADLCPDAGPTPIRLDSRDAVLMGHSIGATTAPLTLAVSDRFSAGILSGAGGSYLENVLFKQSPIPVKPLAEFMLRYPARGRSLSRADPFLNLLQWAAEPADPPVYDRAIVDEPTVGSARHILMFQGVEDTYITPTIANATTASLRVDLAGSMIEESTRTALVLGGGAELPLPASGNRDTADGLRTVVLVQHVEDPIEDGHEIAFQLATPKAQYQSFLETLAESGLPVVPAAESRRSATTGR